MLLLNGDWRRIPEVLNRSPVVGVVFGMPDVVDFVVDAGPIVTLGRRQGHPIVVLAWSWTQVIAVPLLRVKRHHRWVQKNAQALDAALFGRMRPRYARTEKLHNMILIRHSKIGSDSD